MLKSMRYSRKHLPSSSMVPRQQSSMYDRNRNENQDTNEQDDPDQAKRIQFLAKRKRSLWFFVLLATSILYTQSIQIKRLLLFKAKKPSASTPLLRTLSNDATTAIAEAATSKQPKVASAKRAERFEICFITAIYGPSVDQVDQPTDMTQFAAENPTFQFLLYTNLANLPAPGWTTVIRHFPFKRFITHSRWPKFMAWQDERIQQQCPVVIYADAHSVPHVPAADFIKLAMQLQSNTTAGVAQEIHPYRARGKANGGILGELVRIRQKGRDLPANLDASLHWFKAQPDFRKNCILYRNTYFAYRPTSVVFQNASMTFWNRYSQEVDSWRDQPLWCYAIDHAIAGGDGSQKPILLLDINKPLFVMNNAGRRSGSGGGKGGGGAHTYNASSLNDAQQYYKQYGAANLSQTTS